MDHAAHPRSFRALLRKAISKTDPTKNPGFPLNLTFQTNRLALDNCKEEIIAAATCRLRRYLDPEYPFEDLMEDPFVAMIHGCFDASSVFVKNEPHPSRKVNDGRYRCITPVSLVDQLVESCLYSEYSDQLMRHLFKSGSAVGIGFTDRQNAETADFVFNTMSPNGEPILSDDVSGFDSLHTEQTLSATCEVDRLLDLNQTEDWNLANTRWALTCARSISVLGSLLYVKVVYGMLNSGSKDTSRRNTLLRLIYTFYLALASNQKVSHAIANGDDNASSGLTDRKSVV